MDLTAAMMNGEFMVRVQARQPGVDVETTRRTMGEDDRRRLEGVRGRNRPAQASKPFNTISLTDGRQDSAPPVRDFPGGG